MLTIKCYMNRKNIDKFGPYMQVKYKELVSFAVFL